jgi:chemotaxis protein methyltransferase CheR
VKARREQEEVSCPVPPGLLDRLSAVLSDRMGLRFPESRRRDLDRGVRLAAQELGFRDAGSFIDALVSSSWTRRQAECLASHLTVGETYFYRDPKSFEVLETRVLPELIRSRHKERRLKIWSAGCCTGEEPYSLAILLHRMLPGLRSWSITILGTDINPRFLEIASKGAYGPWSFRDSPPWLRDRYFTKDRDGRHEILPEVRNIVRFEYLNLAEDVFPSLVIGTGAMDLILCRNVLMYFAAEEAAKAARKLSNCLREGGWLLVGAVEASQFFSSRLVAVNVSGMTLYRKASLGEAECRGRSPDAAQPSSSEPEESAVSGIVPVDMVPPQPDSVASESVVAVPGPGAAPRDPGAARAQARRDYERGDYERAAETLERLLAEDPPDAEAMALLARVHANRGRLGEANACCEKAIALEKMNPAFRYLHATIAQEQGREESAELSLKRAIYVDPEFILAHFALGNLARRRGNRKEAERHFRNARALARKRPPGDVLPESDGITADRLVQIIDASEARGNAA